MNTEKMREVLERWLSNNIKKEFDPINIDDVYAAFEAGAKWQAARAGGDGQAVAILRREIGEDTWFDHAPLKPGSAEAIAAQESPTWDYCEVYTAPPAPAAKVPEVSSHNVRLVSQSMSFLASVIKGGEEWSEQCEHIYERAQETLGQIAAAPTPEQE